MKKVLFINLADTSFIKLDEVILRRYFDVLSFKFRHKKGWRLIPEMFRQFFNVIWHIWSSNIVYIWFADFHAVFPAFFGRLVGKKVVIVVGGFDAADRKDLNYGVKTRIIGKISANISFRFASHLLPVTEFTFQDMLKNFNPGLEKKSTIIYNCFSNIFHCDEESPRANQVVTICLARSKVTIFRKGVDYYIDLARSMPDIKFYVVGVMKEAYQYLQSISPPNVVLINRIPQPELKDILCKSKVICQFSRYEAFGIALLEGISSGCYPVGYNYGGTAEILTESLGIMINKLDVEEGKTAIQAAMQKTDADLVPIQKSIEKRFDVSVREKNLISFLNNL
ncbi:MAG: glycosyltransferase family 4 protein [Bacteroidales bacterium]|nr:glycosyltransferase family 4 protein [Bacteroidales bacterium]MCF8402910.1 glycosyltransferase family 4 protein [Bacteroidales bacterium]